MSDGGADVIFGRQKLALRTMVVYQFCVIVIQFFKPSGTGADGSPAMGPLPILVGLYLPSVFAPTCQVTLFAQEVREETMGSLVSGAGTDPGLIRSDRITHRTLSRPVYSID